MPTYVFRCQKCGNVIEQLLSLAEYSARNFPMCVEDGCDGQQKMDVQIQPVGAIFKGTGWTPRFSDGSAIGPSTDLLNSDRNRRRKKR